MILKRRTYLPAWTWSERAIGLPTELKTATPVFQEPACKVSSRWIQKELFFTTTEAVSLGATGFQEGTPGLYPQSPAGGERPSPGKRGPIFAIPLVMLLFRIIMRNRDYTCVCVHVCTDTHRYIWQREIYSNHMSGGFQNHSVLEWSQGNPLIPVQRQRVSLRPSTGHPRLCEKPRPTAQLHLPAPLPTLPWRL